MNSNCRARWWSPLVFVASASPLLAQTVPSAPRETPRASEDEAIQLSPFVVDSTKDTGYQASSTLAGTRLNTPLKDIGASISIYTKDFLEDIAATTSGDFLVYATGMEAGGSNGNFGSASGNDVNAAQATPQGPRENPQGASRSRGLSGPTFTRDFFQSGIDIDTYNTDRVTVLRGPNAALFGVGSPAGMTDTTLARADLQRNTNKVSVRLDNNGGVRASADFNRALIRDKLAARLIGLRSRDEYNQRPAFQLKERVYGALSYAPFKTTLLRGNFESGHMRANQPDMILPTNSVSNDWLAAGRPGFDWTFYDDPARNPSAAAQSASNFIPFHMQGLNSGGTGVFTLLYDNASGSGPSRIWQGNFPTTNAAAANAIRTALFHPTLNRDLAADSGQFTQTRNIFEFPAAAYWIGGNVLPGQQPGQTPPGLRYQQFTDLNTYDFRNNQLDQTASYEQHFHAFNITLEQRAWRNRLGLELAYDTQRQERISKATYFSGNGNLNNHVSIDTSVTTVEGLPNPNRGRPFVRIGRNRWTRRDTDDETMRATAYLRYNFSELGTRWSRWLGSHTLSGVAERYRRDSMAINNTHKIDGPAVRGIVADINARDVNRVVYVGPSLIGNNNPLRLEPVRLPPVAYGPMGEVSTFVRAANETDPGAYVRSPATLVEVLGASSLTREVIRSNAATLQSYWLRDLAVTMFGWRRDSDYFATQAVTYNLNPANPSDPGKTVWGFDDFTFPRTPPLLIAKETKSYSVVLKWPRRLVELPGGADVSVFYNNSENFTPVGNRTDFMGVKQREPAGTTREYGINVTALNNKLFFRANRFETKNERVGYFSLAATLNNIPIDTYARWAVEGNNNPHLVALRAADMAKLISKLPANLLEIYNVRVSGTSPNITVTRLSSLPNSGDTTDFTAKGVELELVYNPTSNWRILTNVAKQETVKSNTLPSTRAIQELMAPIYAELGNRPAGNYPIGWQPGDPLPATTETLAQYVDRLSTVPMATELATAGFPSAEQRKWRVNLVTNYTVGKGSILGEKLKGWSIGGGARWQSSFVLGFPSSRLANTTPVFDTQHPYYGPSELSIDGSIGYGRKIFGNRIDWKIQLNGTNLYQPRKLIPISVQPWGQVAAVRLAPERRWYVTNNFSF